MPSGIYKRVKTWKYSEEQKLKISKTMTNYYKTEEGKNTRLQISETQKGRKMTQKTKDKISIATKGKTKPIRTEEHKINLGKAVSISRGGRNIIYGTKYYYQVHNWVYEELGKPNKCEDCKNNKLTHRQYHWANVSQEYKKEISDWKRLCVSCHFKHDIKVNKRSIIGDENEIIMG